MSRDRDSDEERPRRSWSEIDKLRDRPRSRSETERRPHGPAAQARARSATEQYLRKAGEQLFGREPAASKPEAADVRAAHGTPRLAEACRHYLAAAGTPRDASLAVLFLDADDASVVTAGIEALAALHDAGRLAVTAGMRTQLRILSESPDDDVAYAAEELLAKL